MNIRTFISLSPGNGLLLATLLLIGGGSQAAVVQPTLADAVEAAYTQQKDADSATARRNLGLALQDRAGMPIAGDPAFNLKYQTDAVGSDNGFREWEGGVNLPLWWPGQRAAQQREASSTLASADALASAKRLEVAGQVREYLWQLALARGSRTEAELAYESAQQLAQDVERRVEAGELPRSDLLLARKEALIAEDALQQAKNRVQQAEARFMRYTGLQQLPAIRAESPPESPTLSPQHPRLAMLAADVDRARASRNRVSSQRHSGTSLWLGGKTTRDVTGSGYDSAIGVELTVPLGSKTFNAPALAEAEEALTAALTAQQRNRLELEGALSAAVLDYQRAQSAAQRAETRQSLADESLRLSRRAFELGETDLVRLLQARRDALAAHTDLQARRLEVGQAAARLNQVLGVIPQ
jgi:outer membrane protein, heavy metal efflux system